MTCDKAGLSAMPPVPAGVVRVHFDGNGVSELTRTPFSAVGDTLRQLHISNNRLTAVSEFLSAAKSLHALIAANNTLDLSDSVASESSSLRVLSVAGNAITTVGRFAFMHLPELRYLDLSQNGGIAFGDEIFNLSQKLTVLRLSQNKLTSTAVTSSGLGSLTLLTTLSLDHNEIEHIDPGWFVGSLRTLTHIDVSYNPVEFIEPGTFDALRRVQSIRLTFLRLSRLTEGLFSAVALDADLDLALDGNRISEVEPMALPPKSLSRLTMLGNPSQCWSSARVSEPDSGPWTSCACAPGYTWAAHTLTADAGGGAQSNASTASWTRTPARERTCSVVRWGGVWSRALPLGSAGYKTPLKMICPSHLQAWS